jgi:F0F1-type ATP synthase delta subunit
VPHPAHPHPSTTPVPVFTPAVSKEEFEALKKEVEELKRLLKAAKKFDEETGQPDCHMDDKVDFIKKLAEYVGVDLEDIFKK